MPAVAGSIHRDGGVGNPRGVAQALELSLDPAAPQVADLAAQAANGYHSSSATELATCITASRVASSMPVSPRATKRM